MRTKKKILMAISLVALIALSTISATKVIEYSFGNTFDTGSVDISITPMQEEGDKLVPATNRSFLPGTELSYIPTVTNNRAKAYVRIRMEIELEDKDAEPITLDSVYGIDPGWVRKGDYYYKIAPMDKGESSSAFKGIKVPEDWGTDGKASKFDVTIYADAIQEANFTPDFSSNLPWGPVEIEVSKEEDSRIYREAKTNAAPNKLTFTEDEAFESNTESLFGNFGTLFPGDSASDTLVIKNDSANDITVYMRLDNANTILKDKATLSVSLDDNSLYNGSLAPSVLSEHIELATIPAGASKTLRYTLALPEDAQNQYSVLDDEMVWHFKATVLEKEPDPEPEEPNPEPEPEPELTPDPEPETEAISTDDADKPKDTPKENTGVKTGDEAYIALWTLTLIASLSAAAFILKRKEDENDSN